MDAWYVGNLHRAFCNDARCSCKTPRSLTYSAGTTLVEVGYQRIIERGPVALVPGTASFRS